MTFSLANILAVGVGGAIGAVCRFYVGVQVVRYFPHELPLATLLVNLTGSLLVGVFVGIFLTITPPEYVRGFLITGFLGALTTYSTFAIESYVLFQSSFWYGLANVLLNVVGTIVFAMAGYKFITQFIK